MSYGRGRTTIRAVDPRARKDRLIQTRVPESLESALKQEATRRRLPVSQLVRNILEDTLDIVGDVVDGVDAIVQDSIALGRNVGQGVARMRSPVIPRAPAAAQPAAVEVAPPREDLSDVFAWNQVVLNRAANCSCCGTALLAGQAAFVGMRDDPSKGRAWSCPDCVERLGG